MTHQEQLAADTYSQFATVHEVGPRGNVLHVFGDLDLTSAPALETAIATIAAEDDSLIVNLVKCRYLDTSGLTVLVRSRKCLGTRLRLLVAPGSAPLRVLQITGLDRAFAVVTELETRATI